MCTILTITNVDHTVVIKVFYKKLVNMFSEIYSIHMKLASLIRKNLFLKSGFYCITFPSKTNEIATLRKILNGMKPEKYFQNLCHCSAKSNIYLQIHKNFLRPYMAFKTSKADNAFCNLCDNVYPTSSPICQRREGLAIATKSLLQERK